MDEINTVENVIEKDNNENKEPKRNFRDCIYGNIDVSLESMDKFIFGAVSLLVISIVLGVIIK